MYIAKFKRADLVGMKELSSIGLIEFDKSKASNDGLTIWFYQTIFLFGEIEKNWTYDYNKYLDFHCLDYLRMFDFYASYPEEADKDNILWKIGFAPTKWLYIVTQILNYPQKMFHLCTKEELIKIKENNELELLGEFKKLLELSIEDNSIITFNYSS